MEQIKLIQAPIIKHDLVAVGAGVTERIKALNIAGQVATEDTVKSLKQLRTELNAELKDFEEQRKAIKEAVMNPYSELDVIYKVEVSEKYKAAIEMLKDKIAEVEDKIKADKANDLKDYFVELCLDRDIDFLSYSQLGIDVNLSTSLKAYKEKALEFVDKVSDELLLIDTQHHKAEIMVEYKKTLNAAKAIKSISDRKEAEKAEADRIRYAEINRRVILLQTIPVVYRDITRTYEFDEEIFLTEKFLHESTKEEFAEKVQELRNLVKLKLTMTQPLQAPVEVVTKPVEVVRQTTTNNKEELVVASFEVTGTMTQLRELAAYLKTNNIIYKNI